VAHGPLLLLPALSALGAGSAGKIIPRISRARPATSQSVASDALRYERVTCVGRKPKACVRLAMAFRPSQAVDTFGVRRENLAYRPGGSLAKEATMKYVIVFKPRL